MGAIITAEKKAVFCTIFKCCKMVDFLLLITIFYPPFFPIYCNLSSVFCSKIPNKAIFWSISDKNQPPTSQTLYFVPFYAHWITFEYSTILWEKTRVGCVNALH